MSKKIYISSRGTGKVDKDGKITDYTLLSYVPKENKEDE